MATAEQLTKLTTAELKARCLDTAGCITKQDYVDRIPEEEAMAWDHIEGSYEDEGQYDDETGIKDHAAREADAKEEPVAPPPAAAPSNGANRKHKPIVWPSSTEASKAAAGVPQEPIRSIGAKSAAASAPPGPAPKKMKGGEAAVTHADLQQLGAMTLGTHDAEGMVAQAASSDLQQLGVHLRNLGGPGDKATKRQCALEAAPLLGQLVNQLLPGADLAARRGLLLGLEDLCAPFRMFQAVEDALQQGLAAAGPCAAAAAAGDHAAVVGGPAPAPAAAAAPAATGSAVGGASGANNEGHQQQPAAAAVEPPSGLAGFALPSVPPSGSILVSSAAAAADAPMNLAAGAMAAPPLAAPAHPPAPVPQEPPSTPGAGPVGGTDTVMGTGGDSPQQPGPPTSFMLE